jgi:ATP-dependent Clp protease ATP-binding subunit ClpX
VDVSRTGVQRALLKPMEETEVDLKVPHDPISMLQEIERFKRTGKREKRTVNTKNILFIMSGAFSDLQPIIKRRVSEQGIGFGAHPVHSTELTDLLKQVKSEDLIEFGFESEFVGRLPIRAVFERLTEDDLYEILRSPNNPIILGKKLDFAPYGIEIKFEDQVLRALAKQASMENTGARGLVSAVEKVLMTFEKVLPSTPVRSFPVTLELLADPKRYLGKLRDASNDGDIKALFEKLSGEERAQIKSYVLQNRKNLSDKYNLSLTPARIDIVAAFYAKHIMDVGSVLRKIKSYYDEIKRIELYFFKNHDINIVLEEDAIDFIIDRVIGSSFNFDQFYRKLSSDFEFGLKLIREKTGRNRFFITKNALISPNSFLDSLIKNELSTSVNI